MFPLLEQTADQKVPVVLVDGTDFTTRETGVAAPTLTISKAGGIIGGLNDGTWAERAGGLYSITLDAVDTNTVGPLVVRVVKAGVYDAFVLCYVRANTEKEIYDIVASGTHGLAALKTLIDTVNTDLSNATDGLGALKTLIDTVNSDLANGADGLGALKTLIDTVNTDLSNGTDGLGALKTLIDTVNTDLGNGTDGLGALKALIDTLDTVADAVKVTTDKFAFTVVNKVDSNVLSVEGKTLSSKTGDNLDSFFHNGNALTSRVVDNVGAEVTAGIPGATIGTYTFQTAGATPRGNVEVAISTTGSVSGFIDKAYTDDNGSVSFTLLDGTTYYRQFRSPEINDVTWEAFSHVKD